MEFLEERLALLSRISPYRIAALAGLGQCLYQRDSQSLNSDVAGAFSISMLNRSSLTQ
ncbi:MAG: hypothetical protein HYY30_11975 [Chloroflexi bacterium]|nr:hypothetical protein [Chloroflexota bacterium]